MNTKEKGGVKIENDKRKNNNCKKQQRCVYQKIWIDPKTEEYTETIWDNWKLHKSGGGSDEFQELVIQKSKVKDTIWIENGFKHSDKWK